MYCLQLLKLLLFTFSFSLKDEWWDIKQVIHHSFMWLQGWLRKSFVVYVEMESVGSFNETATVSNTNAPSWSLFLLAGDRSSQVVTVFRSAAFMKQMIFCLAGGRRTRYTQKDGGGRVSSSPIADSPILPSFLLDSHFLHHLWRSAQDVQQIALSVTQWKYSYSFSLCEATFFFFQRPQASWSQLWSVIEL